MVQLPSQGPSASGDAEAGNPVQVGASVDETSPASVDEGDVRRLRCTPTGEIYAVVYNDGGGGKLQTKWAEINATASGDTTVVALVASKKIQVVQMGFSVSTAVDIAWKSGAATTKINARSFATNGGMESGNVAPGKIVETDAGAALVINLSTTANVDRKSVVWGK